MNIEEVVIARKRRWVRRYYVSILLCHWPKPHSGLPTSQVIPGGPTSASWPFRDRYALRLLRLKRLLASPSDVLVNQRALEFGEGLIHPQDSLVKLLRSDNRSV